MGVNAVSSGRQWILSERTVFMFSSKIRSSHGSGQVDFDAHKVVISKYPLGIKND